MDTAHILTLNGGSSSIKFALFAPHNEHEGTPEKKYGGSIDRIGLPGSTFTVGGVTQPAAAGTHEQAAAVLADFIVQNKIQIAAVGHRVVHGGLHVTDHQLVTDQLLAELKRAQSLDLAHLPREIALIELFRARFPAVPHVACIDTAFHRDLPTLAKLLPIPRKHLDAGIRRFGFHGLSFTFLLDQLMRIAGPQAAAGKVIFAHLGAGASLAAVYNRKPIDTTMAFTPAAGLMMGTRPGDLDPGLIAYLMRAENLTPDQMDNLITKKCGLLGVSGISSDIRDLEAQRDKQKHADEALSLFCCQAAKHIAALAAVLNGIETLVFSGGIGEHAADIRGEICSYLGFINLRLDPHANAVSAPVISTPRSAVTVRVIPTDEQVVIARATEQLANLQTR